jgi:hypothetical protein
MELEFPSDGEKESSKSVSLEDHSVLRAFTIDEITLFLIINGFEVIEHYII